MDPTDRLSRPSSISLDRCRINAQTEPVTFPTMIVRPPQAAAPAPNPLPAIAIAIIPR
jgi:hypothetical protein